MEYIPVIMSGLALLAATVSLIITLCEKKRNQKRNADMANYVEYECRAVKDDLCFHEENFSARLEGLAKCVRHKSKKVDELSTKVDNLEDANAGLFDSRRDFKIAIDNLSTKIDKLEQGIVPDYEEALAAKNSVDEFNRGLSAIMGYDPMAVARKAREDRQYGGEVN